MGKFKTYHALTECVNMYEINNTVIYNIVMIEISVIRVINMNKQY